MNNYKLNSQSSCLDAVAIRPLVKLYKDVFSTPPWNEAYRCPNGDCDKNFGRDQVEGGNCPDCGTPLQEYYDENKLFREIDKISKRTGFRVATVLQSDETIGFWYGWEADIEEINRQKLGLSRGELDALRDRLARLKKSPWFYIAEFGIKPELRNSGIGTRLFDYGVSATNGRNLIARTTPKSPAYYINRKYGMDIVWNYTDGSERVIMAGDYIRGRDDFPGCR